MDALEFRHLDPRHNAMAATYNYVCSQAANNTMATGRHGDGNLPGRPCQPDEALKVSYLRARYFKHQFQAHQLSTPTPYH